MWQSRLPAVRSESPGNTTLFSLEVKVCVASARSCWRWLHTIAKAGSFAAEGSLNIPRRIKKEVDPPKKKLAVNLND